MPHPAPTPSDAQQAIRTYQQVQALIDERHGRDDRSVGAAWAAGLLAGALVLVLVWRGLLA